MEFVAKLKKGLCIIDTDIKKLDNRFISRFEEFLKKNIKKYNRIGLNCKSVADIDFAPVIEYFNRRHISLFNLDCYALAQASLLNQKEFMDLYLCEKDFLEGKRKFARRRFRVV